MAAPIGNRNAARAKEWQMALKRALARKGNGDFRKALDSIADSVVASAAGGDKDSWQDIANRFDGKPAQSLEVSANVTTQSIPTLSEPELVAIAAGRDRVTDEDSGEEVTGLTH